MWVLFSLGFLFCCVLLYAPGFIIAKGYGVPASTALAISPGISLLLVVSCGIVLGLCGIEASWVSIGLLVIVLSVLTRAAVRRMPCGSHLCKHRVSWRYIGYFLFAGLVTVLFYYVKNLDGPESFAQIFDNGFHLNLITAFLNSHRFSLLQSTTFPTLPIAPFSDLAFYPSAWHIVAALCSDALNATAALGENVANTVFIGVVFPLSMCAFLSKLFARQPRLLGLSAACVMGYAAFPWGFLSYGPLYSNAAAFALLPAVMFLFMLMIEPQKKSDHISIGVLFCTVSASAACAQPNVIFTALVILTPYAAIRLYRFLEKAYQGSQKYVCVGLFFIAVAAVWFLARHLPLFTSVVNYEWNAYTQTVEQAIIDFLDLGFRNSAEQVMLGFFVVVGIITTLSCRKSRWLIPSYTFFLVAYVICGAFNPDNLFGSKLSGFWYNDADRIAACATFVMIPLSAIGLNAVVRLVETLVRDTSRYASLRVIRVSLVLVFLLLVFAPSGWIARNGYHYSAFGERDLRFEQLATTEIALTEDEMRFLERVKSVVGDEAVINLPNDGSCFAYTTNGLNTVYRHFFLNTNDSYQVIQTDLVNIDIKDRVKKAVSNIGARYVLLLDTDASTETLYEDHYEPLGWRGIWLINDSTPGFRVVLSEGDMRLYEIE